MKRIHCRACNACGLTEVLNLGRQPASNALLDNPISIGRREYPLRLVLCRHCNLLQLDYDVPHDELFGSDYPFFSGSVPGTVRNAVKYACDMISRLALDNESTVVEIGGNDGTLLKEFSDQRVINVEMSASAAYASEAASIFTMRTPWGRHFGELPRERADLIIANNVMAHSPDPRGFIDCVKRNLGDFGTFTAQFPWALHMIEQCQFDTIYHEHYSYFTLRALMPLFAEHGLTIYDVEELPIHGGSLQIMVAHTGAMIPSIRIADFLAREREAGLDKLETYWKFRERAWSIRGDFEAFLSQHAPVYAYGAAAKGNTFLNWLHVSAEEILAVGDSTPAKIGKFLPGSNIPIISEAELLVRQPAYVVILPWNWKDNIVDKLHCIRGWGGQFVTAIPELKVF